MAGYSAAVIFRRNGPRCVLPSTLDNFHIFEACYVLANDDAIHKSMQLWQHLIKPEMQKAVGFAVEQSVNYHCRVDSIKPTCAGTQRTLLYGMYISCSSVQRYSFFIMDSTTYHSGPDGMVDTHRASVKSYCRSPSICYGSSIGPSNYLHNMSNSTSSNWDAS